MRPVPQAADATAPAITVVVPAYNEAALIGRCLQSLRRQRLEEPFEIIVVDNGSTDATATIARRWGARVIREPRKGVIIARQTGFDAVRAPYIATTDADSELPSGWLAGILAAFRADPRRVIISGPMDFPGASRPTAAVSTVMNWLLWLVAAVSGRLITVNGCNLAVRAAAFRAVGGFDTRVPQTGESTLLQRMRSQGRQWYYPCAIFTSPRRFQEEGLLATLVLYARMQLTNSFRLSLVHGVRDVRPRARSGAVTPRRLGFGVSAALAAAVAVFLALAVSPGSQAYGKVWTHVDAPAPLIALSFDDASDSASAAPVLGVLEREQTPATFFVTAVDVQNDPQLARRLLNDGDEIGDGGYSRSHVSAFTDLSYDELNRAQTAIAAVTGQRPRLFLPPYGIHTPWQLRRARREDLTVVTWSADGTSAGEDVAQTAAQVVAQARPGAIVHLHAADGGRTAAALPLIIESLRAQGYQFVTVSSLLQAQARSTGDSGASFARWLSAGAQAAIGQAAALGTEQGLIGAGRRVGAGE